MTEIIKDVLDPVRRLPTDSEKEPEDGIALCLSGGGYRAMLFHLGATWRLYDSGWLDRVDRFSSVSGGSITAAAIALAWDRIHGATSGRSKLFEAEVVEPVRRLADRTVDRPSIVGGLLSPFSTIGERVAAEYRDVLFGQATLADLPQFPVFVFNATNTGSGKLVRFSRHAVADWRVGRVKNPTVDLATAVACSSAFPPFLSPYKLPLDDVGWTDDPGNDLTEPAYRDEFFLTDGGVYDNMGLETAWKRCRTLIVCDAGGVLAPDPEPAKDWAKHMLRVTQLLDHQVRSLRKRQVIESFERGIRDGVYLGIRSDIAKYGVTGALPAPVEATTRLAATPTRLKKLARREQERLVNWGYAVTDAGLRRHVDPSLDAPDDFPYPSAGVA